MSNVRISLLGVFITRATYTVKQHFTIKTERKNPEWLSNLSLHTSLRALGEDCRVLGAGGLFCKLLHLSLGRLFTETRAKRNRCVPQVVTTWLAMFCQHTIKMPTPDYHAVNKLMWASWIVRPLSCCGISIFNCQLPAWPYRFCPWQCE